MKLNWRIAHKGGTQAKKCPLSPGRKLLLALGVAALVGAGALGYKNFQSCDPNGNQDAYYACVMQHLPKEIHGTAQSEGMSATDTMFGNFSYWRSYTYVAARGYDGNWTLAEDQQDSNGYGGRVVMEKGLDTVDMLRKLGKLEMQRLATPGATEMEQLLGYIQHVVKNGERFPEDHITGVFYKLSAPDRAEALKNGFGLDGEEAAKLLDGAKEPKVNFAKVPASDKDYEIDGPGDIPAWASSCAAKIDASLPAAITSSYHRFDDTPEQDGKPWHFGAQRNVAGNWRVGVFYNAQPIEIWFGFNVPTAGMLTIMSKQEADISARFLNEGTLDQRVAAQGKTASRKSILNVLNQCRDLEKTAAPKP
jgi:hypothetical protein